MQPRHMANECIQRGISRSTYAVQVVLLDTPGVIVDRRNQLEVRMMAAVKACMRQADAIVAIVDITRSQKEVLSMINPPKESSPDRPPMLVALNKADLCSPEKLAETKVCFAYKCTACPGTHAAWLALGSKLHDWACASRCHSMALCALMTFVVNLSCACMAKGHPADWLSACCRIGGSRIADATMWSSCQHCMAKASQACTSG